MLLALPVSLTLAVILLPIIPICIMPVPFLPIDVRSAIMHMQFFTVEVLLLIDPLPILFTSDPLGVMQVQFINFDVSFTIVHVQFIVVWVAFDLIEVLLGAF